VQGVYGELVSVSLLARKKTAKTPIERRSWPTLPGQRAAASGQL